MYNVETMDLVGYINKSLSVFAVKDFHDLAMPQHRHDQEKFHNITFCRSVEQYLQHL